jgi:dipeptidyl aminopeptidase/acylaminoacyl peptidase
MMQKIYAVMLLLLALNQLQASSFNTREVIIESGQSVELDADEGYVFIEVISNSYLKNVHFKSTGFLGNRITFREVDKGVNQALVKVKAGQFYLEKVQVGHPDLTLRKRFDKDQHVFEVKPGVVNYPGTWVIEYEDLNYFFYRVFADIENRTSRVYPDFAANFPEVYKQVPMVYHHQANDEYIESLNAQLAVNPDVELTDLQFNLKESEAPFELVRNDDKVSEYEAAYPKLRTYLKSQAQLSGGLNQDGRYFLFGTQVEQSTIIGLADTRTFQIQVVVNEQLPKDSYINKLKWIDADTFHYELVYQEQHVNFIAHLSANALGQLDGVQHLKFPRKGLVLSAIRGEDNHLYFAAWNGRSKFRSLQLFKVDVSTEKSIKKTLKKPHKQVKKLRNVVDYLIDRNGIIRAAVTLSRDKKAETMLYHYWFLADPDSRDWQEIKVLTEDEHPFMLHSLSADESYFLTITNQFGDKSAIHKFSTSDLSHLGELVSDEDYEIKRLIIDHESQELVGYGYLDQGVMQIRYFNQHDDRIAEMRSLDTDFRAYVNQYVSKAKQLLIYGHTPTTKGAWFIKDMSSGTVNKLFDINPDYEALPKGRYHHITTQAPDGLDIEGFLVMPEQVGRQPVPLVVMPHGGPIGVMDTAHNDSLQHFFASRGIATLKVNYRGSGGYGKQFLDQGKGQWGEKIEQDIHAVVLKTIAQHPVNRDKICAMGGSYGGYSAVMLTALYPSHYRCAVSWAGVMDLPLLFTNSLYSSSDERRKVMADIIGDPDQEMALLKGKSPVYVAEKLTKPILLLQGMKDFKVEYEHATRLQQMAVLHDLDFQLVLFTREGHSFSDVDGWIQYVARSLAFIEQKLELEK